mmetsp:Transcript_40200/g.67407  ORF Transcript_40200/g.67407 Transcript_40200/m.67407 type:complete len:154 (-) Transcript_40200:98-559(-)|eukprot:CAMPEP_0198203260 /NCGR_PEP_ID=MMETSP1445-20131203/6524_1 /TAXON_ID=36898 /ORGANISM="Pyramimonas sp., Strain CCMP2087" /LENGTH=153 /DNA_ID=CAMNT_0043874569 /DNA_START=174 /DNA_END=635 /DNA_ORIENTATION=-
MTEGNAARERLDSFDEPEGDEANVVGPLDQPTASTSNSQVEGSLGQSSEADTLELVLNGIQGDAHAVAASLKSMLFNIQWCLTNSTEATQEHLNLYDKAAGSSHKSARAAVEAAYSLVASSTALRDEAKQLEPLAVRVRAMKGKIEKLKERVG